MQQTTFKPAWWLNNTHLQTIFPSFFRKTTCHTDVWRERLITPDNDFVDLDFCGKGKQPLVILLHGLTGSSQSGYIKGLQQVLIDQGFRSVALNFRGCSGESNNLARCYHSGETEDIHFVYQTLRKREPDVAIAVVGFSLGGNVLLKWLGEQGNKLSLFCAISVSVPFVLSSCATRLDSGFSRIYRNNLLNELKDYIKIKQQHLLTTGQHKEAEKISQLGDLSEIKSFWQYDGQVVAKLHGYKSAEDYYQKSSSRSFLKTIAIPTLLIQSQDDPFMSKDVIPGHNELSAMVCLELTQGGGHVGFVGGINPFKPEYWLEQRIPEFLQQQLTV
ncbi:MAG: hydrolase [Methylococcaceae bacterium]|nr:hydrolase [Methylococcaceae bacterium]